MTDDAKAQEAIQSFMREVANLESVCAEAQAETNRLREEVARLREEVRRLTVERDASQVEAALLRMPDFPC